MKSSITALLALAGLFLLSGCFGSEIRRATIDLEELRSWDGQTDASDPDSLFPALVPVQSGIANYSSVTAVEEFSLFVQLQNVGASEAVNVTLYAHRERLIDPAEVRSSGIAISRPIFVHRESAVQLDARSYPEIALGFEEIRELVLEGNFYLYVLADTDVFHVVGNVPTVSFLVVVE